MTVPRRGFIGSRTLTGKRAVCRQFELEAQANNAYFIGDPVILNANGKATLATAASSANFLGVIQGVYKKDNDYDPPRAMTFNQPTSGPYLATGQSGFAQVNVDPEQLYVSSIDATASTAMFGQTISVTAGAGNTRAGISGYGLKASTTGTDAERMFQIIGFAPSELLTGRGDKAPDAGVEVKLNRTGFPVV